MILSFEQRHAVGGRACPQFGGDSSSSSASSNTSYNTTTTNNTDARMVLDNGSFGLSNHGGTLAYSQTDNSTKISTDQGAVSAGRDIALAGLNTNANNVDHLLQVADHLMTQQQSALDANVNLTRQLAGTAQTAYADASAQAAGNKNLILAGMAVVAVVGVMAVGKK